MVERQVHAWDKVASYKKGNELRDKVYRKALEEIRVMWEADKVDAVKNSKLKCRVR
jgi:hypothetical protein